MIKVMAAHVIDPYLLKDLLPCFNESERADVAKNILADHLAFTLLIDDVPIAIFGVGYVHGKCLGAWSLLSEEVKKYPKTFHKTMKKLMYDVFEKSGADRLQTLVDADNVAAIRHNEVMGLTREGLLRKMSLSGKDQVVFSLIRGDDGC